MKTTNTDVQVEATGPMKKFAGHPRGLMTLFFTEMWERFSYYGMRAILVLYLAATLENGGMGLDDTTATAIYGLYTASVYVVGLPGGWIADRILGLRQAVFIGGIIIALGHFSLALPWPTMFYVGLCLIVIGTGLLKPNISAIVGDLYPEGGARRDAGFSIYYMGINLGAFLGPIICGLLGEKVNWHLGFAAAGIGMVLGLIQYKIGLAHMGDAGVLKERSASDKSQAVRGLMIGIAVVVAISLLLWFLHSGGTITMTPRGVAEQMGIFIPVLVILYFLYQLVFGGFDAMEKKRLIAIFLLFVAAAVFWSGFEQAGSSMTLFAERLTDRNILGWEMPASWLQSVNPIFIIVLAPVFGALWLRLASKEPSIPAKFAYGLAQLGLGFLVMAWASVYVGDPNNPNLVSPAWLIITYLLHTTGELCLSPVGLSSMTKLSPRRLVGQMMGIWFMASALGNLFAGLLAGEMERKGLVEMFTQVALTAIGAGLVLLLVSRPLKNLIGGVQ